MDVSIFNGGFEGSETSSGAKEITLICSATRGFPEAKLHWEINGRRTIDSSYTIIEDHGLFNVTSTLKVPLNERNNTRCIVSHRAFSKPTTYETDEAKVSNESKLPFH